MAAAFAVDQQQTLRAQGYENRSRRSVAGNAAVTNAALIEERAAPSFRLLPVRDPVPVSGSIPPRPRIPDFTFFVERPLLDSSRGLNRPPDLVAVPLADDVAEFADALPGIRQDDLVRKTLAQAADDFPHAVRYDPGVAPPHLVQYHQSVHPRRHISKVFDDPALQIPGRRGPVPDVDAVGFPFSAGRSVHGLDVGGREPLRRRDQAVEADAHRRKPLAEFVAFPVVARNAEGVQPSDAQRVQVCRDRARGAGHAPPGHDLAGGQPRLQGRFVQFRLEDQVLVQEEVAHDHDGQAGEAGQQVFQAVRRQMARGHRVRIEDMPVPLKHRAGDMDSLPRFEVKIWIRSDLVQCKERLT